MQAMRPYLFALAVLLAAKPTAELAAQETGAIPAAPFRGTLSLGDRVIAIQIRWSETAEPRIQLAVGVGMDDTTSRPMRRDPSGDTLLAVIPGFRDTLRFAPRLEGEALRGTIRQGGQTGTFALRRVVELPLDVIKPRVGDYRLDDGSLFSVGGGEHAFNGLGYIHFETGRTGSLFAVDSTRFVAGTRRYDSDPASYTVQFEGSDRIVISTADGRHWRGSRRVLYREEEVSFPTTGGVQLAGTYTVPTTRGPHPAIILLHGSNPHTRFRDNVVTFFASRGIAVLSWDKRGNGASGGSFATATIDTFAADGAAAIRWLRARPEIDRGKVGVWGISQGGWPASVLAAGDSAPAFVILHAGSSLTPGVQGEDEMRLRVMESGGTQADIDGLLAYYRRYLDVLRGGTTRDSLQALYTELRGQGNRYIWSPAVATSARERWQAGINDFDPVPYWSRARVPVLALFGEFDGYVPPETNVPAFRAAFARSGNRDTSIVVFPRANHRFEESSRRVSNDWMIGSRYLPEYYTTMAAWLDRLLHRSLVAPSTGAQVPDSGRAVAPPRAQSTPLAPQERLLDALQGNKLPLTMTDGRPAGPGWDWLVREARDARFTLIGEEHGVAETAQLSAALFAELRGAGYNRVAIELSPIIAQDIEAAGRRNGLEGIVDFLTAPGTFTFYNMREEAQFLADVIRAAPGNERVLWGFDREIFSDRYLISKLERRVPRSAREAFARLKDASTNAWAQGNVFTMSQDPALVSAVRAAWPNPDRESDIILRTLEESLAIHRAARTSSWTYTQRRTQWNRDNMAALLREAQGRTGPSKVMMKFGYNHMIRGANYVNAFDLGAMADEVAALTGDRAFHILVLPGPGSRQAVPGPAGAFGSVSSDEFDEFRAGDQRLTRVLSNANATGHEVIDLRALRRLAMRGLESWNADVVRTIHGYDAAVIWKGAKASSGLTPSPGTSP